MAALLTGCSLKLPFDSSQELVQTAPAVSIASYAPLPVLTTPEIQTAVVKPTARERLASAIAEYKQLAADGGWPTVPSAKKSLKPGETDPRVPALRARLALTDGVPAVSATPEFYDAELEAGVRRFQARHGLEDDGAVGRGTVEALNVPIEVRIAAMELSLAKMEKQEPTWGDRYIAINIAEASYRYVDGDEIITGLAIVGQPNWQTPELDSVIDRIDLNPSWTVPSRIAAQEIWPKVKKEPDYLAKHGMKVIDGGKIYQGPGAKNPLGQVKFVFDNPYSVYLHDTNRRDFFEKDVRYLSHGCVRVSDPLTLASALILKNEGWSDEKIEEALAKKGTTRVKLERPVPVHIVYNTAWVAEDGVIHLRADVYERDGKAKLAKTAQQLDAE